MINLHMHSIYSDGSHSIEEIKKIIEENNISVAAITDHDTLNAYKEVNTILSNNEIIWIPGVELSTESNLFNFKLKAHLLGYGFDYNNSLIKKRLDDLYKTRYSDNYEYVSMLIKKFPFLSYELIDGIDYGKYGWIKKMIINQVKDSISPSNMDVLINYIDHNKPHYREYNIPIEEAIDIINKVDGYPILAHPFRLDIPKNKQIEFIKYLKTCGLLGIESFNTDSSVEDRRYYHTLSRNLEMMETGGTDFHKLTLNTILYCSDDEINEESEFIKKMILEKRTVRDYYERK